MLLEKRRQERVWKLEENSTRERKRTPLPILDTFLAEVNLAQLQLCLCNNCHDCQLSSAKLTRDEKSGKADNEEEEGMEGGQNAFLEGQSAA